MDYTELTFCILNRNEMELSVAKPEIKHDQPKVAIVIDFRFSFAELHFVPVQVSE